MGFPRQTVFSTLAVFAAVWLTGKFLLPLVSPFLLGTALALAAEPMVRFLNRRARMPRMVSTAIGVSMAFCFLALLLLTLCAFALRQLKALAGVLPDLEETARSGLALVQTRLLELASHAPQGIRPLLEDNVRTLLADSEVSAVVLEHAGDIYAQCGETELAVRMWKLAQQKLPEKRNATLNRKIKKRKYIKK